MPWHRIFVGGWGFARLAGRIAGRDDWRIDGVRHWIVDRFGRGIARLWLRGHDGHSCGETNQRPAAGWAPLETETPGSVDPGAPRDECSSAPFWHSARTRFQSPLRKRTRGASALPEPRPSTCVSWLFVYCPEAQLVIVLARLSDRMDMCCDELATFGKVATRSLAQ